MSFLKTVYNRVNVNSSTLSGATDVVVVKNKDGTYLCSLFRVRFGKMSIVSKAKGKRMVSIRVNGVPVEQKMRVGSDGEAYFLSELSADDNEECASPAGISPSSSMVNFQDERTPSPPPMGSEPNSGSSSPRKSNANTIYWNSLPAITNKEIRKDMNHQQQLIRNMILTDEGAEDGIPLTPPPTKASSISCLWSQRMTPSILRRKKYNYSVSLQQGQSLILHFSVFHHDVGFCAYFNTQPSNVSFSSLSYPQTNKATECIELVPYQYVLSSSGWFNQVFTAPANGSISFCWDNSYSYFNKKTVKIEMYLMNEQVPSNMDIQYTTDYGVMKLQSIRKDGIATLTSTSLQFMTLYIPINSLSSPVITIQNEDEITLSEEVHEEDEEIDSGMESPSSELHVPLVIISLCRDQYRDDMKEKELDRVIMNNRVSYSDIFENPSLLEHPNVMFFSDRKPITLEAAAACIVEMAKEADRLNVVSSRTSQDHKPLKSFRVSSDILKTWPLHDGENELAFIPEADKRMVVTCKVYLLNYDAKIIISDVDGTVTKEDVMGHVMYAIHQDYTQKGIVKMYNRLEENGYVMLYLTARAVGQMKDTRKYLEGIEQDGMHMPKGPIICSPNRTFASLIREVVRRKPQEFKIPVLRSISDTFVIESSPFVGGFGNRPTDTQSYISAGVNKYRIFIINTKGVIKYIKEDGTEVKTNFAELVDICDQFFPPINRLTREDAIEDESKEAL